MGGFNRLIKTANEKGIIKKVEPKIEKPINTKKEQKTSDMLLAKRKGRQYSIATSSKGDLTKVKTTKKTLLG